MNFKKIKLIKKPFPILITDNFIKSNVQKKLIKEILEMDNNKPVKKVMGGRYQYSNHMFKKDSECNKIFDFFNQNSTFRLLFDQMTNISNTFSIDENSYIDFVKNRNKLDIIINKFFPVLNKKRFFLEMDFSVAKNNYFREPHHDKNTRILSFLLYLNTTKKKNGGSLEIYQYKKFNKIFERFPNKNNLKLIKKIPPKFGKLIVFLSSPESIHGVEKFVAKNNEKRIFLYGSYTSFSNVNWIKSS